MKDKLMILHLKNSPIILLKCALVAFGLIAFSNAAFAGDEGCDAVAIQDTSAIEDSSSVVKKGETIQSIHIQDSNSFGDPTKYAQEGGYSYPAINFKLLNCHIEQEYSFDSSGNSTGHKPELVLNNTPENYNEILYNLIYNELSGDGMSEAGASNAAAVYLKSPDTVCGLKVRSILYGNTVDPAALARSIDTNGTCDQPTPTADQPDPTPIPTVSPDNISEPPITQSLTQSSPWTFAVAPGTKALACIDQGHEYYNYNIRHDGHFKSWDHIRNLQPVRFDQIMAEGGCDFLDDADRWVELGSDGRVAYMRLYPWTSGPQITYFFMNDDLVDSKGNHPRVVSPVPETNPRYDSP